MAGFVGVGALFSLLSNASHASPGLGANLGMRSSLTESPVRGPFAVPAALRGRVNFWRDVFSKYGRYQIVVHHREFPQIIFGVIDISDQAASMGPVELSRYRSTVEQESIAALRREIEPLARGEEPESEEQQRIAERMSFLPRGAEKYRRLLDEDLIRTQTGIRERYVTAIKRAWRYLPVMEQIFVSEYGLPKELTRIPFIESSFDYTAYSSVGAAGIWQFMPRTARGHGMEVGRIVDERRDPIKATRAAAEYLRSAYRSLGTWPLAITSYNHGVGGVRGKVTRAGTDDLAEMIEDPRERYFGFASTNFYPEFLAAVEIFNDPSRYFPEISPEPPLRFVSFEMRSAMHASTVCHRLGMPLEELKEANYALLEPVWSGSARIPSGYTLRIPVQYQEGMSRLLEGEAISPVSSVTTASSAIYGGSTYRVRPGDSLAQIAKRFGVSSRTIMELNGLSKSTVRVGQVLVIKQRSTGAAPRQVLSGRESQHSSVVKNRTNPARSRQPSAGKTSKSSTKGASAKRSGKVTSSKGSTKASKKSKTAAKGTAKKR